jgi:ergothioneine biosynthesis protein EgtB
LRFVHINVKLSRLVQQRTIQEIIQEFIEVRKNTMNLFRPLQIEDAVIQANDFGSPPNWHIAHVTWFFHQLLNRYGRHRNISRQNVDEINLRYLNSYYQKFGEVLPKSERGRYPRPSVQDTIKYRAIIEEEIISLLNDIGEANDSSYEGISEDIVYHITLGNQHEMQHQELMIYDFQYYYQRFSDPNDNYVPVIRNRISKPSSAASTNSLREIESFPSSFSRASHIELEYQGSDHKTSLPKTSGKDGEQKTLSNSEKMGKISRDMAIVSGGLYELGFNGKGFCYDNELPEHKVYVDSYKIDKLLVTNNEFMRFIEDSGYENYRYWLSDGWDLAQDKNWNAPLYWERRAEDSGWIKKDFRGVNKLNLNEPVTNISYYEADAYAKWAKKRLPTEAEWEKAASWNGNLQRKTIYPWGNEKPTPVHANLMESNLWGPCEVGSIPLGESYYGCHQMIGDVWEWTSSEYVLYPGFASKFDEYTDKWAINQKVLRGGSFATPSKQIGNSYRNYFRPHERILFSGFRCAKDL